MIQVRGRDQRPRRPEPDPPRLDPAEAGGWYGGCCGGCCGGWYGGWYDGAADAGVGRAAGGCAGGRAWAGSIRVCSGRSGGGGGAGCRGVGRVGGGVPAAPSPYIQSKSRLSPPAPAGGPLGRSAMVDDATVLL